VAKAGTQTSLVFATTRGGRQERRNRLATNSTNDHESQPECGSGLSAATGRGFWPRISRMSANSCRPTTQHAATGPEPLAQPHAPGRFAGKALKFTGKHGCFASNNGVLPQNTAAFLKNNGVLPQKNSALPQKNGALSQNTAAFLKKNGDLPQKNGDMPANTAARRSNINHTPEE